MTQAQPKPRPSIGDVELLSRVPDPPGFPEGIAVNGHTAYVSTMAYFGTAGTAEEASILAFDVRTGELLREYVMKGQDISQEHGLSEIAFDAQERLYICDIQRGIIRLKLSDGSQEVYAPPFPNLKPQAEAPPGAAYSTTYADLPPLANGICFDAAGNLYAADSLQALLYRIRPGGGGAEIYFQDWVLDGGFGPSGPVFGPNGVRVGPDGKSLYFSFTGGNKGIIYRLPLVDRPTLQQLEVFHEYTAGEGPDGIAFGQSGRLYVALAYANAISVLDASGAEVGRYPSPEANAALQVPVDGPAVIAFDERTRSLLFTNHAPLSRKSAHFGVMRMYVDDVALPLHRPSLP